MTQATAVPLDKKYLESISKGLDSAFKRADDEPFDPHNERIVIFSDHHKGVGDPADDFRRCEHAYTSALGYYLEAGYKLFVLGDGEELWEEHAGDVIKRYRDVLQLEAEFVQPPKGGLSRFYGNHDDQWKSQKQVSKHLSGLFGDGIKVREALRLTVDRPGKEPGTLFFVHGHQGTADSDRFGFASRLFVRHVWRPLQRKTGYTATTPARDFALRAKHDRAMYEWAVRQPGGFVMIAGHTHRPVFSKCVPDPAPTRPITDLEEALDQTSDDRATAAAIRAELEYARTGVRRPEEVLTVPVPCYFNTGCCSFPDGDITGLEIADGQVRLVRWPGNLREIRAAEVGLDPAKRILETEDLEQVFAAVSSEVPADAAVVEREITPRR
jgi:hypothetical protein